MAQPRKFSLAEAVIGLKSHSWLKLFIVMFVIPNC